MGVKLIARTELHERAIKALIRHHGRIADAAKEMKMPARELRRLANSKLTETLLEIQEQALDEAEDIVRQALHSENTAHRLMAAGYLLGNSPAAKRRGFRGSL
jgi:hypothetical protein